VLDNANLIKLIEVNVDVVTEFGLKVQLLDSDSSVLLLDVEHFSSTLRDHNFGTWDMHFLECYILNRTILLAYLFKSLFGNLYLIGD